jgi:hypothetical protein
MCRNHYRKPLQTALAAVLLVALGQVQAAIYTVTTTADSGVGSLRQALLDANATAAVEDQIHFNIPGPGPHVITVQSALPFVNSSVTIDGYTQSGALMNTLSPNEGGLNTVLQISLVSSGFAGNSIGFFLNPANGVTLTVQGLNIYGFAFALRADQPAGTSVLRSYGNFICTDITGDAAASTANDEGIRANKNVVVGGELPWQRNLISGCDHTALITFANADIRGNLIGTDRTGTRALGNGGNNNWPGVFIQNVAATVQIGGNTSAARNLISGNDRAGITLARNTGAGAYANMKIQGNYIGTDWRGTAALGNGFPLPNQAGAGGGIKISSGTDPDTTPAIIGGFAPGEGNLIAFNRGAGISSGSNRASEAFESRGNAMHSNNFGGATNIDLGAFGRSANDAGDPDTGVNDAQNWPVILSATESGGMATVRYRVDTLPANATYPLRIDFYRALNDGSSGRLLAQDSYTAAMAQQIREFTFALPNEAAMPITAIASNANRSSELAPVLDILFDNGFE